jgi:type I restriction enzyme S subunit
MEKLSLTRKVTLGELGIFRNGVNFSKDQMGSGFNLINVKNIFGDGPWIDFENLDLVDLGDKGKVLAHTVQQNDLFFVRSSVKRDGIGLVRLAKNRRTDAIHCGFVIRFRLNNKETNALFLAYLLRSPRVRQKIINLSGGSAIINISQLALASLTVDLPTLLTQHKIAAILSAYDDLIENNLRRIKILEEMAQNLYREWFVKFRFPGHQHARFTDSPLGRIPEGWEVNDVENTFKILGGGTPSKSIPEYWRNGIINWYTPTDLTSKGSMLMEFSSNQISELGLQKSSARLFPPFSVMMTSRATLGVISINTTKACTNQGFITCIPNDRFPLYTLYYWLKENVDHFISLGTGATFKEITKGIFKTIELAIPARDIIKQFEGIVNPMGIQILSLQKKNNLLRCTRELLLPKLISGEVDVSELDITIPEETEE